MYPGRNEAGARYPWILWGEEANRNLDVISNSNFSFNFSFSFGFNFNPLKLSRRGPYRRHRSVTFHPRSISP
jgi:hypothetical protein